MASGECSIASIVLLLRKIEEEIKIYCCSKKMDCSEIIRIVERKRKNLEEHGFDSLEILGL